ncbi:MAG: hypothetical protein J7498_16445, partial [Sphingobium sp.]|nr:hypothetical protein [Sphingobium sp.]
MTIQAYWIGVWILPGKSKAAGQGEAKPVGVRTVAAALLDPGWPFSSAIRTVLFVHCSQSLHSWFEIRVMAALRPKLDQSMV